MDSLHALLLLSQRFGAAQGSLFCMLPGTQSEEFHEAWRVKARDVLARTEWRRRKLTKRVRVLRVPRG